MSTEELLAQYRAASHAFHTAQTLRESWDAQDQQNAIVAAAEAAGDDAFLAQYPATDEAVRLELVAADFKFLTEKENDR